MFFGALLLLIVMLSIVTGQRSDSNRPSSSSSSSSFSEEESSQNQHQPNPIKTIPRGNIKKVIKVNKLSKTNFPTKTTSIGGSMSTAATQTTENILLPAVSPTLQTNASTQRLTRQNLQQGGRRVLRKSSFIDASSSDTQSQASSHKQTYLIGDLDDDYYSRRRARFLFMSRVGK